MKRGAIAEEDGHGGARGRRQARRGVHALGLGVVVRRRRRKKPEEAIATMQDGIATLGESAAGATTTSPATRCAPAAATRRASTSQSALELAPDCRKYAEEDDDLKELL